MDSDKAEIASARQWIGRMGGELYLLRGKTATLPTAIVIVEGLFMFWYQGDKLTAPQKMFARRAEARGQVVLVGGWEVVQEYVARASGPGR